jgi:hypothetical protein
MSTAGDYRTWLRKFPKEPADRMATALAAVDAFEKCQRKRRMTAADLRPLYFQILSDPNDVSFCLATAFMISPAAAPTRKGCGVAPRLFGERNSAQAFQGTPMDQLGIRFSKTLGVPNPRRGGF